MTRATVTWALAILLGAAVQAQAAATPEQKCQAAKNQAAGKYAACRQGAEKKIALTGDTVKYDASILKCATKFATAWQKAIDKATKTGVTCLDAPLVEADFKAVIDVHTDNVATGLEGNGLQCAGDLSTCNTNLATCTADLPTCDANLTSTQGQLTTCNGNLSACNGTLTTCQDDLPACQSDLAAAVDFGNGTVDPGEECDQADLDGETCTSQGFAGGKLVCGAGGSFDTSGCYAARFVDNADGTITDYETRLVWQKRTQLDSSANPANPHDADNVYPWSGSCTMGPHCQPTAAAAALCAANSENGTYGCSVCLSGQGTCSAASTVWTLAAELNGVSFGGATNWRVPTLSELQSIIDYSDTTANPLTYVAFHGASCGAACTDITSAACSCTRSLEHWAGSIFPAPTVLGNPVALGAWVVLFGNGNRNNVGKTFAGYTTRAVRDL